MVVSDITDENTLTSALEWKKIVEDYTDYNAEDNSTIPIILMQNKVDLKEIDDDLMSEDQLKQFGDSNGFFDSNQVSAKENIKIEESFQKLVEKILQHNNIIQNSFTSNGSAVHLTEGKKSSCCF